MSCKMCKQEVDTPEFTMAFQPIVDLERRQILAYESLIRPVPRPGVAPAACLRKTLQAAAESGFPSHRIIFEVTEAEPSRDPAHLKAIFTEYKSHGMITAIDDFGAGHSGLNLLADFQPDIVKIDMNLTRGIHKDPARRAIVRAIAGMCTDLGISVVAEGIEHADEVHALVDLKVNLFQGFLFARPAIESLPPVDLAQLDQLAGPMADLRRLEAS